MSEIVESRALSTGASLMAPVREGAFNGREKLMVAAASILVCGAMLSVAVSLRLYAAF